VSYLEAEDHSLEEIPFEELVLGEEIGRGSFGVIRKGKWKPYKPVIIKEIEGTSEEDFIHEAEKIR
jgi:hypothetical protein